MSQDLKNFFTKISSNQELQQRLYTTAEVADVVAIAQEMGYTITPAEVLRAQVGRVLLLPPEEIALLTAGSKAKTCAQWGRGGGGYLDDAGFWINQLLTWDCTQPAHEQDLENFLHAVKTGPELAQALVQQRTYDEVAQLAHTQGYHVSSATLLRYIASQILMINDERANTIARGSGSRGPACSIKN